jgi:3-isopropylmalate/(R)-2-methylmalate dehydratase large subunit
VSPLVAAATAVLGTLSSPWDLENEPVPELVDGPASTGSATAEEVTA